MYRHFSRLQFEACKSASFIVVKSVCRWWYSAANGPHVLYQTRFHVVTPLKIVSIFRFSKLFLYLLSLLLVRRQSHATIERETLHLLHWGFGIHSFGLMLYAVCFVGKGFVLIMVWWGDFSRVG